MSGSVYLLKDKTIGILAAKASWCWTGATVALCLASLLCWDSLCAAEPEAVAVGAGISSNSVGLCLVLDSGDGRLAAEVAVRTKCTVFAIARDERDCERTRLALDHAGVHGVRATAACGSLEKLPLPDCYANYVLNGSSEKPLNLKEVMRVLGPDGIAVIGGGKSDPAKLKQGMDSSGIMDGKVSGNHIIFKGKMPAGLDEWSYVTPHADNLMVTRDASIRPPFRTQWMLEDNAMPGYALGISGGRVVFRNDPAGRYIAWNVFNGMPLWERRLTCKNKERFGLIDDTFYSAEDSVIVAIDAATGETRREYRLSGFDGVGWKYGARGWFEGRFIERKKPEEIKGLYWLWLAVENGRLYAMAQSPTANTNNVYDTGDLVCAMDLESGKELWKYKAQAPIRASSLALSSNKLCFYTFVPILNTNGQATTRGKGAPYCLDAVTGKELWGGVDFGDFVNWSDNRGPLAGIDGDKYYVWALGRYKEEKNPYVTKITKSYNLQTGSFVREYQGGAGDKILNGKVYYMGGRKNQYGQGFYQCMDLATGKEIPHKIQNENSIRQGCGSGNMTPTCVFAGGQGFCAYDLETGLKWEHMFFRNPCNIGPTIGNGMVLQVRSPCQCEYVQTSPIAMAPAGTNWVAPDATKDMVSRLVTGPAFDIPLVSGEKEEWTHYRGNAGHTGEAGNAPKTPFKKVWEQQVAQVSKIPHKLTPPSCGGGLVFTASRNGDVWALEQATGEIRWKFLSGAGVRVTPAYGKGRVLFGSDDGWVYCLDAKSGKLAWKFRVAPEERYINRDGQMSSTWPSMAGVLLEGDTAYCAAGLYSYDGAYLYALDIRSGKAIWARKTGDIDNQLGSPQGIMALAGDALVLPTITAHFDDATTRTGAFRKSNGELISWYPDRSPGSMNSDDWGVKRHARQHMYRGSEAVADGDAFFLGGPKRGRLSNASWPYAMMDAKTGWLYGSHPILAVNSMVTKNKGVPPVLGKKVIVGDAKVYDRAKFSETLRGLTAKTGSRLEPKEGGIELKKDGYSWGLALCGNVVVILGENDLAAYDATKDRTELCRVVLKGPLVRNGFAVSGGSVFVVSENNVVYGVRGE
jgi:outer membrane protein assembly factor BamB